MFKGAVLGSKIWPFWFETGCGLSFFSASRCLCSRCEKSGVLTISLAFIQL